MMLGWYKSISYDWNFAIERHYHSMSVGSLTYLQPCELSGLQMIPAV